MPGGSTKEKGREEGEADEGSEERKIGHEIAQEVVAGIKEKASAHDDAKATAQRTAGQGVKQNWTDKNENQMGMQWEEDEKLEETLERRRMEGSSWQVEVMQNVSELVVHERMFQGEKLTKEQKKVKGWSVEEMKEKANSRLEIDTEEMTKWRGMSQEEMVQCWKNFAEKLRVKFWTTTRSWTVIERLLEAEALRWSGGGCAEARSTQ